MAQDKELFRGLLTEAVYAIHIREGKSISVIHDELGQVVGKQGSAIEHWRKGNIPSQYTDVRTLAEEIIRRTQLGTNWIQKFFDTAGYPTSDNDAEKLLVDISSNHPKPFPNLLLGPQTKVIGRDVWFENILTKLKTPDAPWIVTIDGMGGIGKTALASAVARKCREEKLFDEVIWIDARGRESQSPRQENVGTLTFETILNAIGLHLKDYDVPKLRGKEKEERVQALLRLQRVLVVLDNLETAKDPQNEIADRLLLLLTPSKAMLTSRHRFMSNGYGIRLKGLENKDTRMFMNQEASFRGIARVETVEQDELDKIAVTTGGSPLALKLVIGQLAHLPLEIVLEHLRTVRPVKSETEKDEYINLYKFIFWPSWKLLPYESKKLLLAMANFTPGLGGIADMIQDTSDLQNDVFFQSIDKLWELSLLEVDESSSLQRVRYYLHALTQHFVLADIAQEAT